MSDQSDDQIHVHSFEDPKQAAEMRTRAVMWITLVAMIVEIGAGSWFNSMALLADGWHMSSHALAIGMSAFAYAAARRYARDPSFAFGTWKIEILSGFTGALFLLLVAAGMVFGSVERFLSPGVIHYKQAMVVAVFGLLVNIVCAVILGRTGHTHHHDHSHDHTHDSHAHGADSHHDHHEHHQDLNLKSAYLHVVADAATSVLAIFALVGGFFLGWPWLDPAVGIVGAVLIAIWAKGLLLASAKVLLDREMDHPVVNGIRTTLNSAGEFHGSRITDLHVWRVGTRAYAYALSVQTAERSLTPGRIRSLLAAHPELVHGTIEVEFAS